MQLYLNSNDALGLHGAWRLDDGRFFRGPDVYYGKVAQQVADAHDSAFAHPTSTALDPFNTSVHSTSVRMA